MTSVLSVGEALVDVVSPTGTAVTERHVGGSPANVAVGLARLGTAGGDLTSWLTAHLADDADGRLVAEHLSRHGVRLTPGSQNAERTSTATVRLDGAGDARYAFDLDWRLGPQDLSGIGHLHTGSIAATLEPGGSAVVDLMAAARRTATVSYDPNCRPTIMGAAGEVRQRIEECVGRSDVVKASLEDVTWLYGDAPLGEIARLWGQLSPALVVITRGGEGALVHLTGSGTTLELPPAEPGEIVVVDTVGAGDSFMAGLLSGLLETGLLGSVEARGRLAAAGPEDVAPALDRAVAAATWTVGRPGAAAPSRTDLG